MDFGAIPRPAFGRHAQHAEEKAPGVHQAKAKVRRMAMFKEARELLAVLPGPGESLHCIQSGSLDLTVLLMAILERHAVPCRTLRIATLCYAKRNCVELLEALEAEKIGSLTVLASLFFRSHYRDLHEWFAGELAAFPGCRLGVARSHAKLALYDFADGTGLVIETSANARTNGNAEAVALTHDRPLHDFYARWVDEMVGHESGRGDNPGAG